MENDIVISIICNTYNHEKYIYKALEGFVMQEIDVPFEVLIHDDASTDGTAEIIREFEKKYPTIIKPIYEVENQYSKHDGSLKRIQYGRVRGKYVAFCEGDDYWIDPLKLQKQFNILELHPEIDICAHAAFIEIDGEISGVVEPSKSDMIFGTNEVIAGGGGFVASSSLMYRSYLNKNEPEFRKMLSLDYTCQIHGALKGGMLYLSEKMSVYRLRAEGSWTRTMGNDLTAYEKHMNRVNDMLICLDAYTNDLYHTTIEKRILHNRFVILECKKQYKQMTSKEFRPVFTDCPFRQKVKIWLGSYFPFLLNVLKEIKKKVEEKGFLSKDEK